MRKRRRGFSLGGFLIVTGILIFLALIMPTGFWWFSLSIILIVLGIGLLRC